MAFNVARTTIEEPLISLPSANSVHDISSSSPELYASPISGTDVVGIGYGDATAVAGLWRVGLPIGHSTMKTAIGFSHSPNFTNRVGDGNVREISSAVPPATGYLSNLGCWMGGVKCLDKTGNDATDRLGCSALQGNRVDNACDQIGNISLFGMPYSFTTGQHATGNGADQASEEGGDDSVSGKKIKFLCSYGGKILPRPSDGTLRYVGGQTRIISFRRDVKFNELAQKMADTCGQPVVIKYQLPNEDFDALISVSCSDDLENMLDEHAKLIEQSSDNSAKLRFFLFSASELDASSVMQFGDSHDCGQRYVEAVNGITDGISGGIAKKENIASGTSTQTYRLSCKKVLDNSIPGHGEDSGVPSSSLLSPKENVAVSQDTVAKLVFGDHGPAVCSIDSAVPLEISMAISRPPHTSPLQNEVELEMSAPITLSQQQIRLQQSEMDIPPPGPYLQPMFDPYPNLMSRADYVQPPSHVGFLDPQLLGKAGPLFSQQQFYVSSSGFTSNQVVPMVHMTPTAPSSHVDVRANVLQPVVQQQQNHLDQYNDGSISGSRIAYQVQVPPIVAGGNYGCVQVPAQEHVIFPNGLSAHQQVLIPEKIQKLEDCYMYQKTLPHAHSDQVVEDQRDNSSATSSDFIPSYHSLSMQENLEAKAVNRVMVTAPLKEGVIEQGIGTRPKVVSKVEPLVGLPFTDTAELSHNLEQLPEQDGNSALTGKTLVSLDDVIQQCMVPIESRIKQDGLQNNSVYNGIPPIGSVAIQTSEFMVQGSPKEYTNELADVVLEAGAIDNWATHSPIEGRMDSLKVYNHEVPDQYKLPIDKDVLLDNKIGRSKVVLDANQIKKSHVLPCSSTEISYGHNLRPVDCNEVKQASLWGIPGSNPQPTSYQKDVQDSSNSLFSNKDPWNMHYEAYFPPPIPNKVPLKREAYSSKNYFAENLSGAYEEQSLEAQVDEALCQPFKHNLILEHDSSDLHVGNVSGHEDTEDGDVQSNLIDVQSNAKVQDVKIKPLETAYVGFPVSDGLGRLQVIKNCDLEELRELGSGTFGTVYHGKWRGTDVAIKRINDRCFAGKPSEQERLRADFWNEAINLADLHHPNVVAFYGVVLDGPGGSVATVTEDMVNGSLRNALQKNERNLDNRKRLLIATDVAFGMEYLHGKKIVHFDLKSDNLLVNLRDPHRPICKVGDLGLSKAKRQTLISGGVRGALPWMAPELLNGSSNLVSEKVDVFSFGIVLWELLTGEEPYADLHYGAIIGGIVSNTLRPPVPECCDPKWKSLMEKCWSSEASQRPSFTEIATQLRSMAAKIPPKGQTQQQQLA